MHHETFFELAKGSKRLVTREDGFVYGETAGHAGFTYAYYLYIDGKVVEKSKYSEELSYKFKTKTSSNDIAVKFFYKCNDNKVSIIEPLRTAPAPKQRSTQKIEGDEFISDTLSKLNHEKLYETLSVLNSRYEKLNNKDKSRQYVRLIKEARKQGCDPTILQVLSKNTVLIFEDRYTLITHLVVCIDSGSLAEANNTLLKLQYKYGVEEEVLGKLRKKLFSLINKYVSEFELPIGYRPKVNSLTISQQMNYSDTLDYSELLSAYKEGGIYSFIEKLTFSCVELSEKEKARQLSILSQEISTISLEDAIYLNKMSISTFPLVESYQLLAELYFKNKQYYKSAYFLGFLDYFYTKNTHKLMGSLILKALTHKFEEAGKIALFEEIKKKNINKYIEIENSLEKSLLAQLPNVEVNALHSMTLQQQND